MKTTTTLLAALLCALVARGEAALHSSAEAEALSDDEFANGCPFEITAVVVAVYPNGILLVKDECGFVEIVFGSRLEWLVPGKVAKFRGHTSCVTSTKVRDLEGESAEVVGEERVPEPVEMSVGELLRYDGKVVLAKVRGTIADVLVDDIDPEWNYVMLRVGADQIPVAVAESGDFRRRMPELVDAEVEVTGAVFPGHAGFRLFIGPFVRTWSESCIKVISPPPDDPFKLPPVGGDATDTTPMLLAADGFWKGACRLGTGYVPPARRRGSHDARRARRRLVRSFVR